MTCGAIRWRFVNCRRGVIALELAIVFPIFALLLFSIIAFTTSMTALASMQAGAQVAARSMAIGLSTHAGSSVTCGTGVSTSVGNAEYYACRNLPSWGTYHIVATQNCTTLDDTVTITASGASVAVGDIFNFLSGRTFTAQSIMMREGQCT
jgi:Flp pilus assembly protein TadG